jgi:DNA repair protein RadC
MTRETKEAAKVLKKDVLDHLIITADDSYFSFADEGMM